ncbi:MAG: WG repeat-containing protein, partial [Clostridia bacterium]|nr:WG repeat-containing protein [Clostridia bacterium]
MKKITVFLLVICLLLSVNTFAADNYTIVEMSEFADVDNFSEGLCAVQDKVSKRWGFVDVNKNWVISPQFQSASYFKNDVCTVNTVDGETVLINRNGEIVFKCSEYNSKADSDKIFLEKHGQYKIVFENSGSDRIPYYVTLLNSNYFTITPNDVKLCAFKGGSQTLFWENNQKKIYNYKGIEITDKLSGNVDISGDKLLVNNKYVIGFGESGKKLIAFNIDGNKIAEFDTPTVDIRNISLSGDIIIIKGNYIDTLVYNIPLNKQIGTYSENDNVKTYYDKFFTVKKNNGTSALYS